MERFEPTFRLELSTSMGLGYEEPNDVIADYEGCIEAVREDDTTIVAGSVQFSILRLGLADELRESLFDVFDAHRQEFLDLYTALFDPKSDQLLASVDEQLGGIEARDILFLDTIELLPEFRGRNVGLRVAAHVLDHFGAGCGLMVCRPFPLQFDSRRKKDPSWAERMGPMEPDQAAATRRVVQHWSRLGLERIGLSDFFGRNLSFASPWLMDRDFFAAKPGRQDLPGAEPLRLLPRP